MKRALVALLAVVALAGCDPPSQADPARYGEVSVYVAPDCSPVGYGPAMMAPRLGGEGASIGFGEAFSDALGEDAPTELDLAEYRRVIARDGGL